MMQNVKAIILGSVIVVIVGLIFYLQSQKPQRIPDQTDAGVEIKPRITSVGKEEKEKEYPIAKEITTPDGFINTDTISVGEFVGKKIVLVDFWTYSCINCQRTIPYLNAWYEKYKDKGLVIVGVHTPEFEFEKEYANVLAAVKKFNIKYPVVLDNDFSTWTAYGNRYWPRKYLIDIDGYIVYDHIGEGAYAETEKRIQELLEERKIALGISEEISKDVSRPKGISDVDFSAPRSPEIYFGAARNTYLGSGRAHTVGVQLFDTPPNIKTNVLYLVGHWDVQAEFAENKNDQAKIIFRYQAKDVYFVAGGDIGTRIKIIKDGTFLGEQIVGEHTLYHVIQDSAHGEHTLEIIIGQPGLRAFTFTFG